MRDELRSQIESVRSHREQLQDLLDSDDVPEENVPRTHRSMGAKNRSVGVYLLRIGECREAASEFGTATNHFVTALEMTRDRQDSPEMGEAIDLRKLLEFALLSGDDGLVETAADLALDTPSNFPDLHADYDFYHYYAMALAAAIAESETLEPHLVHLDDAVDDIDPEHTEGDVRGYYRSRYSALSGIASRDEAQFRSGISDVLARRKGMDVRIDSEFVPECVYEIA